MMASDSGGHLRLETSCYVDAGPARVFAAWTTPDELLQWWGPDGVKCVDAEVDLCVGGQYRIANELPDKSVLWIKGTFEAVEIPNRLVYSWRTSDETRHDERVSVTFFAENSGTRVTVVHERIPDRARRNQHLAGWEGCLCRLTARFHL